MVGLSCRILFYSTNNKTIIIIIILIIIIIIIIIIIMILIILIKMQYINFDKASICCFETNQFHSLETRDQGRIKTYFE